MLPPGCSEPHQLVSPDPPGWHCGAGHRGRKRLLQQASGAIYQATFQSRHRTPMQAVVMVQWSPTKYYFFIFPFYMNFRNYFISTFKINSTDKSTVDREIFLTVFVFVFDGCPAAAILWGATQQATAGSS
jgi:hypothetical protein